jgi:RNA polymerase sigma-70 factor (ECF subfamily)
MSAPQRAAFDLVKGQGLSLARAATTLGTSVTGVKLRTHRAYRLLRAELLDRAAA